MKSFLAFLLVYISYGLGFTASAQALQTHKKVLKLMGSRFEISALSDTEATAKLAIEAAVQEIERVEKLISSWDSTSQTAAINRAAGTQPVAIPAELFALIERCLKISALTQGAFDISFAATHNLWKFDGQEHPFPDSATVAAAVEKVNYRYIQLKPEDTSVFLLKPGMRIAFGAIGKGYAANRAKRVMQQQGIASGLVNAGGDLTCWGGEDAEAGRAIAIADPRRTDRVLAWLRVQDGAVVTSGNYEKYFTHQGERYSHIIDPRTGYPLRGLKSVTIVCPDAELADGLATAVFVLGKEQGLALIDRLKNVEGLLVDDQDQLHTSKNLQIEYVQAKP